MAKDPKRVAAGIKARKKMLETYWNKPGYQDSSYVKQKKRQAELRATQPDTRKYVD